MYWWLAQTLGVLPVIFSVLSYQMKRKWQILICSALANLFTALSFLFLGGAASAMAVCFVGVCQTLINAQHAYHAKFASNAEKGIFLVLYLACGIWQFQSWVDLFPLLGSLLFMIATFQKKAQQIRYVQLVSNVFWVSYDGLVGSSAIFTHLLSIASILIGIWRYRKKETPKTELNMGQEQTTK